MRVSQDEKEFQSYHHRHYPPGMVSSLRNPHPPPSDVYAASLLPVGEGYALWYPEPHDSTGEPQIGDVGYVRQGAFIRLFNINTSRSEHALDFW